MPKTNSYLDLVGLLSKDLESHGFRPTLVGGMALVLMGSPRVTNDFDFLVSLKDLLVDTVVEVLYKHGFQLISKFNEKREVLRTIDNPRIAAARLNMDKPESAYFYHPQTELKVDLLFDFPFPASEVAGRALEIKVKHYTFRVASRDDLIRMKEIAYSDRKSASDAQDLEFLKGTIK